MTSARPRAQVGCLGRCGCGSARPWRERQQRPPRIGHNAEQGSRFPARSGSFGPPTVLCVLGYDMARPLSQGTHTLSPSTTPSTACEATRSPTAGRKQNLGNAHVARRPRQPQGQLTYRRCPQGDRLTGIGGEKTHRDPLGSQHERGVRVGVAAWSLRASHWLGDQISLNHRRAARRSDPRAGRWEPRVANTRNRAHICSRPDRPRAPLSCPSAAVPLP